MFRFLSSRPDVKPDHLKVCRLSHPVFTQFMAEYLVAAVINAERKHYQVQLLFSLKNIFFMLKFFFLFIALGPAEA